ncbi:glutamate--tRNA ligase, cytoplasmic [Tanacetum coccineum]
MIQPSFKNQTCILKKTRTWMPIEEDVELKRKKTPHRDKLLRRERKADEKRTIRVTTIERETFREDHNIGGSRQRFEMPFKVTGLSNHGQSLGSEISANSQMRAKRKPAHKLNLVYTLLSKRKLLWFVENGKVDGWDDAHFPTVQGIVRRGLQVEALIQFILEQLVSYNLEVEVSNMISQLQILGASKTLNLMEWDKLWNINKKIIDPVCPQHTAIVDEGRVLLTLKDGPEPPFVRMIPKHRKYEGAGEKATTFTKKIWIEQADAKAIAEKKPPNVEVTLMDWGNAIVEEIKKDSDGNVTELSGKLHLEGYAKATQLKLTWLPEINEFTPLTLVEFGYLITKKNVRRDVPFITPSKPIALYAIPDGKQTAPPKQNPILISVDDCKVVYKLRKLHEKSMPFSSEHPCRRYSLAEIQLATNNFDPETIIGKGGFEVLCGRPAVDPNLNERGLTRPNDRPTMSEVVVDLEAALALQERGEYLVRSRYNNGEQISASSYSKTGKIMMLSRTLRKILREKTPVRPDVKDGSSHGKKKNNKDGCLKKFYRTKVERVSKKLKIVV